MTSVARVISWLEKRFPASLAESWDTPGLQCGRPSANVSSVHFAVDPTLDVVREARECGASMLVTHHPLMLRGITHAGADTVKGAVLHELIEAGIALYAAHTNADSQLGGTNDALASALGMADTRPLVPQASDPSVGSGRIGAVEPMSLKAFAERVAAALPPTAGGVLFSGNADATVTTVAVCGGSGDSFLEAAASAGVDVYVTADLRHHPALDAREAAVLRGGKPYLVSFSHAASESLWLAATAQQLSADLGVATTVSTLNTDPWTGHIPSRNQGA